MLAVTGRSLSTEAITKIRISGISKGNGSPKLIVGSFMIKISGMNTKNPKALFMFINHSSDHITKYELFHGRTHYKAFGDFISKTLL